MRRAHHRTLEEGFSHGASRLVPFWRISWKRCSVRVSLSASPESPLKRLRRASETLGTYLPGESALARAMFLESRHRLCLGWQSFRL